MVAFESDYKPWKVPAVKVLSVQFRIEFKQLSYSKANHALKFSLTTKEVNYRQRKNILLTILNLSPDTLHVCYLGYSMEKTSVACRQKRLREIAIIV